MWTRRDLKAKGKFVFKANYWKCVLVSLILGMVGGGFSGSSYSGSSSNLSDSSNGLSNIEPAIIGLVVGVFIFAFALAIALQIFVFNPLVLGCNKFYVSNHYDQTTRLNTLGYGFTNNYMGNAKTMFLRDLYTVLWTLLFIVPGIIKSYEYRMIPYIIAENPEISTEEAFALSKEMMTGNKWNAFVLDLSFIGWILLSILTLGILAIFYVSPYIDATNAELYFALKKEDTTETFDSYSYVTAE